MNQAFEKKPAQQQSYSPTSISRTRILATVVLLLLAMIAPLSVPGNPDHLLPLLPELTMLIFLSLGLLAASKQTEHAGGIETFKQLNFFFVLACSVVLVYLLPRMLWSLNHTPRQVWNPCANIAPSAFVRLECYLHGAITQFPGPRQFYMIVAAFLAGTMGFILSRLKGCPKYFGLYFLGGFSALYCIVSFTGLFRGVDTIIPQFLGKSEFGKDRFALIITNPGWVWPYLSSGLVSLVWLTFQKHRAFGRFLLGAGTAIVTAGVFYTGQRGGLLLCLLVGFISSVFAINKYLKKRCVSQLTLTLLLVTLAGCIFFTAPMMMSWLLAKIGRSEFFDGNRFSIWNTALPHVLNERPIWGFGYGSWFQEFRTIATKSGAPLYDTAHNLYVQLVFEHGLAGTAVISVAIFALIFAIFDNLKRVPNGIHLFLLALVSFGVITVVQEIDYIRPAFYLNAFFWGTLCGLYDDSNIIQKHICAKQIPFRFIKGSLNCLVGVPALCAVFIVFYFPFGLYPFEGDLSVERKYTERWIGPFGKIVGFGADNAWSFKVLPLSSGKVNVTSGGSACESILSANKLETLHMQNIGKYRPQSTFFKFDEVSGDSARFIAARIYYPPETDELNEKIRSESNPSTTRFKNCELPN